MGDHIDEEEVYLNPSKYVSDESFDHVHRELCLAALTPLKSWLKVYPVLILKLIILSVFFAFLPPFLIGVLQAVVSLTFLFLVFYRDVVMRGVVDFIDLIHSARGDESRYAEESNGGAQSLHPQYFYILQQACFKWGGLPLPLLLNMRADPPLLRPPQPQGPLPHRPLLHPPNPFRYNKALPTLERREVRVRASGSEDELELHVQLKPGVLDASAGVRACDIHGGYEADLHD